MFFSRHRPTRKLTELFELRKERDAQLAEKRRVFGERALARAKSRYDAHPGEPVVWNLMLISGGCDWGAFGAGFLKGWSRVQGPLSKPEPDVVTGVSTGALISPFAFLGDDKSIESVLTLCRNPKPDWVKTRWPFYFLPANESFATVPGLQREMRARVEMATRAATITAKRHLFAQAEIARLKHGGEMSKYSARDYCARVTDENS